MKTVKLIAKPNTWFKEGTEVFDYNEYGKRLSLEEFEKWKNEDNGWGILVRGIRVCEEGCGEVENLGYKVGDERIDGELCGIDEFDVEIIED